MSFVRGQQSDRWLKLSQDRKVSPRGTWQDPWKTRPGRWVPTIPNSFGLPAGTSCPGRTAFCESCYAVGSERSPGVADLVAHNLRLLTAAGTVDAQTVLLDEMLDRYLAEADRVALTPAERVFRIHWDGDFFSTGYALAWRRAIQNHPEVTFWVYTRSFRPPVDVTPILDGLPNLAVYLSVDAFNLAAAVDQLTARPSLRAAWCALDYRDGRTLSSVLEGRQTPLRCPENALRVPLMSDGVGACVECRLCPDGRRDILFASSHKDDVTVIEVRETRDRPVPPGERVETFVCSRTGCGKTFSRPVTRGRKPRFCSRDCQVAAYRR